MDILAIVLIGINILLTIFLLAVGDHLLKWQTKAKASSVESFERLVALEGKLTALEWKTTTDRDSRLARHLARRYVAARIEHQERQLRVAREVAEEPEQDLKQMELLQAHWSREVGPRLEEVIAVGQLSTNIYELLHTTAQTLLEERQYGNPAARFPGSFDEAVKLFNKEVERLKRGGEPSGLGLLGAAEFEARDLAHWAVIKHFKSLLPTDEGSGKVPGL